MHLPVLPGFPFREGMTTALALAALAIPLQAPASTMIGSPITSNGYVFINFDFGPLTGTAVGSNANGISNNGLVVGTAVDAGGAPTFNNFAGPPLTAAPLNTGTAQTAFGINTAGNVVGGNGTTAFFLPNGGTPQSLAPGGTAFGINDAGNIVGQFTSGMTTPGFLLAGNSSTTFAVINAPSGPDVVNAQGINNHGLIVGFYLGTDGQVHGFFANAPGSPSVITGVSIQDPLIPSVPGEPGATFVFSQVLGVNDNGLAAGYYGDSTASQHGFFYDTNTGTYRFLDDPAEQFSNGVEVTQITGISDTGELSGFYSDANGTFHSFVATPVGAVVTPEPGTFFLVVTGMAGLTTAVRRRTQIAARRESPL